MYIIKLVNQRFIKLKQRLTTLTTPTCLPKKKSARRGRPRKNAITKLKVKCWFSAVALASGKNAAELEREFADPNHIRRSKDTKREIRPNLWDKYRRGEVEPRMRPSPGKSQSIVQTVEAKYPGTARILTLPLWMLLDLSQPVSMEELDEIQQGLPDEIQRRNIEKSDLDSEPVQLGLFQGDCVQQEEFHFFNALAEWTFRALSCRRTLLISQQSLVQEINSNLWGS